MAGAQESQIPAWKPDNIAGVVSGKEQGNIT